MATFKPNTLYYGDNLTVLRDFPPECVDLVYLDPPFNSNRSYNVLFKEARGTESEAQIQAFEDTWRWGKEGVTAATYDEVVRRGDEVGRMLQAFVEALGHNDVTAYLTMMAPRLVELRRVLKPTGSIYLHCDPTASHYLKALMDSVFGAVNFRSEIVWKRTSAHNAARRFGPVHDTLFHYSRSDNYIWNRVFQPYDESYIDTFYRYTDADGRRFRVSDLTGAGTRQGESGEIWRGQDPTSKGRHWALPRNFPGSENVPESILEALDYLDAVGRVYWPSSGKGVPGFKRYLEDMEGLAAQDVITDIAPVSSRAKERLGYPTQKPEALLERIIRASSNQGDVVLDPFCGCGTAVVAAHRLGRRWLGIDITWLAVALMRNRLTTTFPGDFPDDVPVDGEPADEAAALALAERDKYQFQFWAVGKIGGTSRGGENRKGRDRGIDGVIAFPEVDPKKPKPTPDYKQVIISVKGGATGPAHVRELAGTVERESAAIGVLVVTQAPTREMEREAASAGLYRSSWDGSTYPKLQILTAGELVQGERVRMPSLRGIPQYAPARRANRGSQGRLDV